MHRSSRPLIAPFEFRLQFLRVSSFHARAISRDKGWNSQMKGTKGGTKRWNDDSKKLFPPLSLFPSRKKVETRRRDEKSSPPPSENPRAYISVPLIRLFFFAAFLPFVEPFWPYTFARVSSVSGVPISQLVEMRSQPQINDPLPVTCWHVSVNPSSAWPVYLRYIYNIFNDIPRPQSSWWVKLLAIWFLKTLD